MDEFVEVSTDQIKRYEDLLRKLVPSLQEHINNLQKLDDTMED
jgi:hypothetical protein